MPPAHNDANTSIVGALVFADAARYLGGCSVTTVRRLVEAGHFRYSLVGDTKVIRVADLDAYLEATATHEWRRAKRGRRARRDQRTGAERQAPGGQAMAAPGQGA